MVVKLIELAKEFFIRAACKEDFCVALNEFPERIIFGGWNRFYWSMERGFSISAAHCTTSFKEANKSWPLN